MVLSKQENTYLKNKVEKAEIFFEKNEKEDYTFLDKMRNLMKSDEKFNLLETISIMDKINTKIRKYKVSNNEDKLMLPFDI